MADAAVRARSRVAPAQPRPARRRPRWWLGAALLAVIAAGGAGVGLVVTSGAATPSVPHFAVLTDYHVTYAVTTAGSPPSTEQLWVHRPFGSADVTTAATGARDSYLTVVNRLGVQVLRASNAAATELRVPASTGQFDVRADIVVPAGIATHRLKVVGQKHVLGRRCVELRSASPLRSQALLPIRAGSHTDTCIDAQGLILDETSVRTGRVVSHRRATAIGTGAAALVGAPLDLTGALTPYRSGGGAFTPLTLTSRPPGSSWSLLHPPSGFHQVGRYAVVPPQPQAFGSLDGSTPSATGLPGSLVTELDDVFVRGADVIVLQQGSSLNGATFAPPTGGLPVDVGPLGPGQLLIGPGMGSVSIEPGNGKRFIRLSGTLPPSRLLALARSLATAPGGRLVRVGSAGA